MSAISTRNGIALLTLGVLCSSILALPAHASKFPPYPNVWSWELKRNYPVLPPQLFLLSNGDVLAGQVLKGKALLFSGDTVVSGELRRDSRNGDAMLTLSNGSYVSVKKQGALFGNMKLLDGSVVESSNDNWQTECYHGPIRYSFSVFGANKSAARVQKVIFILLDKPRRYIWDRPKAPAGGQYEVDPCTEEGPPGFSTRVESVSGAGMLALADGTFLMPIGNHLVVRFDEHLNTKSPLLNHQFFVFDLNNSKLLIDSITHKNYDLSKTGYQPVYDDLYRYLSNLKDKRPASLGERKELKAVPARSKQ